MKIFNKNQNNIRGFTLIELVVSIGIIAILAGLVIALINPLAQFRKANDARRKSDLAQIQKALEQYYQDTGRYPKANGSYNILDINGSKVPWGSTTALWQKYMNVLPGDPITGKNYVYFARNDGQAYWLYAFLENASSDTQSCNNGNVCPGLVSNNISSNSCGGICNFGLTSPNVSP